MSETSPGTAVPAEFAAAVKSLQTAAVRSALSITDIPAPSGLAPFSLALAADVMPPHRSTDLELGTGRFVVLYDPAEPEAWGGRFRVVCFAGAPLEPDIGVDPFLAQVAWSWLVDALDSRGAQYTSASGTATKTISTGFGELSDQGDGSQIELRASWTPTTHDLRAHVEGWAELVCMLAGLPPAEGVSLLSTRRSARD